MGDGPWTVKVRSRYVNTGKAYYWDIQSTMTGASGKEYTYDGDGRFTIDNTKACSLRVTKNWMLDGNAKENPEDISFTLHQVLTADGYNTIDAVYTAYGTDGVGTVTYDSDNKRWNTTVIENLPKYVTLPASAQNQQTFVRYKASYYVVEGDITLTDGNTLVTTYQSDSNEATSTAENAKLDDSGTITIINNESGLGALQITKTVKVNGAEPTDSNKALINDTFTFTIKGTEGSDTSEVSKTVTITFANGQATKYSIDGVETTVSGEGYSQAVLISDLIPGTYTVAETESANGMSLLSASRGDGGSEGVSEDRVVTVIVSPGEITSLAQANFINTFNQTDIAILKVNATDNTSLSGAKFRLLKWNGVNPTSAKSGVNYVAYDAVHGATAGVAVSSNGTLTFSNLADGKYKIEESKVPDGFIRTEDNDIYIIIENGEVSRRPEPKVIKGNSDSEGYVIDWGEEIAEDTKTAQITYSKASGSDPATFTVGNTPGVVLPATGGEGTRRIYLISLTILFLAGVMLLLKRKRIDNQR